MAPIKVAIVTPGSFPIPSPGSSSVERVVEKFAPLLMPHVEPRIYGRLSKTLPRAGYFNGVLCERFPAFDKGRYALAAARAVSRFSPNVIDVENRPQYVPIMKRMNPGKQVWLYLHSSSFIAPSAISPAKLRRCYRAADKIIVNSEFLRNVVAARSPEAAAKLRVIYPGVETSRFPSQYSTEGAAKREALRQQKGLAGKKVVLFIGRLIPLKGVHHLLRIVPQLARLHPELVVVIVGSPFYGSHRKTPYARMLERLGQGSPGHVRFVPYIPHSEVPGWMLAADVAVVPSGQREAFGLVNVEAMSCGVPVVATRAGGMTEIIQNGVTGYLVNPKRIEAELLEKLHLLLGDKQLRQWMGLRSRERVEQTFTWQHTADRWIKLLKEGED
ncbi:glycosyltransferase family 4 protein [Paenibacillus arenilitoris]|uniref:Glycosyltransferase family 4 protein n=1 Tax=Paenibacillus arenilitoris TaxID=2772299 RepID=A0A927CR03_9BACL|nr:glycosyltransferase family 4 protein [Paenibacillus arenilitoris]MBD2872564.1 glycosyltransferase family 4 protein [Paenibacillus arenilitoris]